MPRSRGQKNTLSEVSMSNLNKQERILAWRPFWKMVYLPNNYMMQYSQSVWDKPTVKNIHINRITEIE